MLLPIHLTMKQQAAEFLTANFDYFSSTNLSHTQYRDITLLQCFTIKQEFSITFVND